MLEVQNYLKSGKTLIDLKDEYDINASWHPSLPIFKLNYGLESPKLDPIVHECRSLVLDKDCNLVARAFPRFFNLHEVSQINDHFNWSDFDTNEKLDGWLCVVFYYNNQWIISSRSAFGDNPIDGLGVTFREVVLKAIDPSRLDLLDKTVSYVFEVCGKYTKIVREYEGVNCYLLSAFRGETELGDVTCDNFARILECPRPQKFLFKSAEEVYHFIRHKEANDKTYEGVVLRDSNNLRIKVKSSTYIALHHLRGEGNNRFSPKYLVPLLLDGTLGDELEEMRAYFPETTDVIQQIKDRLELHQQRLSDLWDVVHKIEDQKEFALRILNETPFCGMLFIARKSGKHPREVFRESPDMVYKVLYKNV